MSKRTWCTCLFYLTGVLVQQQGYLRCARRVRLHMSVCTLLCSKNRQVVSNGPGCWGGCPDQSLFAAGADARRASRFETCYDSPGAVEATSWQLLARAPCLDLPEVPATRQFCLFVRSVEGEAGDFVGPGTSDLSMSLARPYQCGAKQSSVCVRPVPSTSGGARPSEKDRRRKAEGRITL